MEQLPEKIGRLADMKPQWINNTFIGSFWMGTPKQIAETQAAIDEELALYEEAATHDDPTSTEIGETHQFEEFPQNQEVSCQAPIK